MRTSAPLVRIELPAVTAYSARLTVEPCLHGGRIDSFLVRHFRNYTTWRMQRMVSAGCVTVNDQPVPLSYRVRTGELVSIRLAEPPDKLYAAEPHPLQIVFEDPWLIVLDKPPGVVTHPVAGTQSGTLANRLQAHFDTQTAVRGLLRPGIVHRLDRMTSGLLVVSKHHLAHRRLSIQFQNSQVRKSYLALVRGCVQNTEGEIALPIGQRSDSVLMTTGPQARKPRPAVTRYRVVQRFANRTLLEATPLQGRNHQIRVHCAAIGHPLLGDDFYAGDPPHCAAPGLSRHALHASRLAFTHPLLQSELRFSSALPEDLTRLLTDEPAPAST